MREIKFRAFDKERKEIVPVAAVYWNPDFTVKMAVLVYPYEQDTPMADVVEEFMGADKFELMQFTGLKDINGKDIYDGDIVSHGYKKLVVCWDGLPFHHNWCGVPPKVYTQFVKHQETGDGSHPVEVDTIEGFLGSLPEVIGNRFEHPELLKEEPCQTKN